jgi:hypothetical protein
VLQAELRIRMSGTGSKFSTPDPDAQSNLSRLDQGSKFVKIYDYQFSLIEMNFLKYLKINTVLLQFKGVRIQIFFYQKT